MKETLVSILLGLLFGWMIVSCAAAEDRLVEEHCSGLSGYAYGECQASIY